MPTTPSNEDEVTRPLNEETTIPDDTTQLEHPKTPNRGRLMDHKIARLQTRSQNLMRPILIAFEMEPSMRGVSRCGIPMIAAYGLIALLRLTMTPDHFKTSYFYLGRFGKPFYLTAALFNALIFAVMASPFFFPVTADTFNFACVIFGAATIFGILSYIITPEEKRPPREKILQALNTADGIVNQSDD